MNDTLAYQEEIHIESNKSAHNKKRSDFFRAPFLFHKVNALLMNCCHLW